MVAPVVIDLTEEVPSPSPDLRSLPADLVLACASESSMRTCCTLRLVCVQLCAAVTGARVRMLAADTLTPMRVEQLGIFKVKEVLLSRWIEADIPVQGDAREVCSAQMRYLLHACPSLTRLSLPPHVQWLVAPLVEEACTTGRMVDIVARVCAAETKPPLPRLFQPTMILYFGRGIIWPGWEIFSGAYPRKIPKVGRNMFWPDTFLL